MKRPMVFALLALLAFCTVDCTTPGGARGGVLVNNRDPAAEEAGSRALSAALALQRTGDVARAKAALDRVAREHPGTNAAGEAVVALARILLDEKHPHEAQERLEKLLVDDPTSQSANDARYLLALAQLEQGDARSAAPALQDLVDRLPDGDKREASLHLGRQLVAEGHGLEGVRYMARALELSGSQPPAGLEDELIAAVDTSLHFADVRALLETEAKPSTALDEALQYKLARIHLHLRDFVSANRAAAAYLERYPQGRFAAGARDLTAKLAARVTVDGNTIGVILPLTGDYKSYGKRALVALRLGLGIKTLPEDEPKAASTEPGLDPATGAPLPASAVPAPPKIEKNPEVELTAPSGMKIVVRDSKGDPARATGLVRELVEKNHAIAIIGDILLDTSLPVALAAEEFGVPLLSLSRRDGIAAVGPWTFRLALTAKKQAVALAQLAMDGMKMKRFAIMYPRHASGIELMNAFWDEVEKHQGEVTAVESYAHDQTTFTAEAKALVGRTHPEARAEYAKCRTEAKEITNEYRRRKASESCSDKVTPVVDFEALLIPDGYRTVSYIVPALVAEDVLVTNDHRTVEAYQKTTGNSAVRPVQLLGSNMWNDAELGKRLGRNIDGAVFVDGFSLDDHSPKVSKFVESFTAAQRSRPTIIEAQAYDAASLMAAVLGQAPVSARSRETVRQALATVKDFQGVTGIVRFDEEGDSTTPLRYFRLEDGNVQSKDPAEIAKGAQG